MLWLHCAVATAAADWRNGMVPQGSAYAFFFGEPFTASDKKNVARPCTSALSFNEAPSASTVCTGCDARSSLGEAQLRRVTDYGYPPCGTEPEAAVLQLPAAALCFAALAFAAFATFVATAALSATTGSSAVAVATIAPATVASAWSRRLCLVLVLLQASGVQAQTSCGCQYVRVTGAESVQSQRMGIYRRTDSFVGDRSVYERGSPATQYLYYDTNQGWSIHERIEGLAGVDGPTSAEACPHNASGTWTAWNGSAFSSEYDVQVECMDFAACECERFLVSGAESSQPGKMGYYTRAGNDFNARSVYTRSGQNASDLSYLFLGSDHWWQVAQELEADDAYKNLSLISLPYGTSRRDTTCPEPNTTWWVWNGTAWSDGYAVQVACSPLSPPAPPPPYAFTDTASLRTAAQEYNADASSAIATYGPISSWGVSAVRGMHSLFKNLDQFNADISSWDTSSVTEMVSMFEVRSARALPAASTVGSSLHAACLR